MLGNSWVGRIFMKIAFVGISLSALSQNGPTNLVVWIFDGQSTVPPLRSFLPKTVKSLVEPIKNQ